MKFIHRVAQFVRSLTEFIRRLVHLVRRLQGKRVTGATQRRRGGGLLLVDVRLVLGTRPRMRVGDLLAGLAAQRPLYATWEPHDLIEQLAALDIPLAGTGRNRSVQRAAVVAACKK